MKSLYTILFIILFSLVAQSSQGQSICSFDQKLKALIESSPENAENFRKTELQIKQYINSHPLSGSVSRPTIAYTIPVVVHVMHTGGAVGTIYNPTDATIVGAINYLNQVFAGTYAGMEAPVEGGPIVNLELTFALAQRTATCGFTNGINRVNASSIPNYTLNGVGTGGCTDLQLKDFARWDPAQYYNIWVVSKIDGADGTTGQFTAGYAYFAGAPATLDGTVMLATQTVAGNNVMPHELGHAFNLYHTFEGSNLNTQCPVNTTCSANGDEVCDTDPVSNNVNGSGVYSFVCRTGTNSCTGTAYTRNTEKNFMAYTTCFTLFTNGQKTRVQAAMSLPSRASLGASLGATPCGTVINFNSATVSNTENTVGTTVGCRTYTDYTYSMNIGAAPSQNATVTLTYGGTATKSLDYEVTTNGNFTTLSNTLVFNAGATTPQTFTVRIYNDANVESSETAIINFTLNNGGGNATIGTSAPSITINIGDNDSATVATSSATVTVGTLAVVVNGSPFNSANATQRVQTLYTATELLAAGLSAGNINALQFYINSKATTGSFNNFTIKMAQVPNTTLHIYDNGVTNFVASPTQVFTTASYSTIAMWNIITLSTPFAWNGSSNLVVEYCYSSVTGTGADQIGCYTGAGVSSVQSVFCFQSGINCSGSFSSFNLYASGTKPQIRLGLSVTGTTVETAASTTKTEHFDIASNDYFYSASGNLMARISGVNQPLGCVTTAVENAGTTWTSFQGGLRSAKIFNVTPTTNTATANYNVGLYFTNAELGGNAAAGLRIAKTTAATIGAANGSNTVLVTPTATTLGTNSLFTANFTGFSKFFLVNSAVVLPVKLLYFNGEIKNNIGLLHWATSQEINNTGFDIEKSADGINFEKIGFVAGQINTTIETNYNFNDYKISDIQFYRLKQIDVNGQYEYSNIVKLINTKGVQKIISVTNPFYNSINVVYATTVNKNIAVTITDTKGALLYSNKIFTSNNVLTLNNLPNMTNGVYILRTIIDGQVFTNKVIKSN